MSTSTGTSVVVPGYAQMGAHVYANGLSEKGRYADTHVYTHAYQSMSMSMHEFVLPQATPADL